ncbi:unnamed protein product [Clonostachys rosea]|uniref:Glucose receptor Git3-like N-terminal domain-containing protein n=1 Tax=Bionectria ochroleuca TaxID=29856 RepID=A0ABY6UX86_BIOOC|nr:unnamed protein product [Clonostachys rosea]
MAEADVPVDLVVAIPTFIGSLLSFLASLTVIVLQVANPPRKHFRHSIIINLLASDLINSLNNTISGAIAIGRGKLPSPDLPPNASCVANAWIGQLSVQTIDFNILIISITVLLTVFRNNWVNGLSSRARTLICVSAWIPGLITSNIGLGLNSYGYVSGNWCWIRSEHLTLRYALGHGWRLAIFVATISIYTYIYIHLQRTYNALRMLLGASTFTERRSQDSDAPTFRSSDTQHILVRHSYTVSYELEGGGIDDDFGDMMSPSDPNGSSHSTLPPPPNLTRMMLMNGYPLAYIMLWIPGIANRLAESLGGSPRWLQALQATTQFIGMANSLTYGISEQMRRNARKRWKDKTTLATY